MAEKVCGKAYGKINIGLDVLRRRPDGYHEVKMIMQTVDICDELEMELLDTGEIVIVSDTSAIPNDQNNLIYKAIMKFREATGETAGVKISLTKRIPIAAGMAGGSSDAACAMRLYNKLTGHHLPLTQLQQIGVKIGADVPYCLQGGTALSEGIGEILTKLPTPPACYIVIGKPDISVSTKFVYENLTLNEKTIHPDIDGMRACISSGDLEGICSRLGNVLETVTVSEYPVIAQIKELLLTEGAKGALMSGSGPTVFAIFDREEAAKKAKERLANSGLVKDCFVTGFIDCQEEA